MVLLSYKDEYELLCSQDRRLNVGSSVNKVEHVQNTQSRDTDAATFSTHIAIAVHVLTIDHQVQGCPMGLLSRHS